MKRSFQNVAFGVFLSAACVVWAQTPKKPEPGSSGPEQITAALMAGGIANTDQLQRFPREKTIPVLLDIQRNGTPAEVQGATFLLAVLRYNYAENRARLLRASAPCVRRIQGGCDETVVGYLGDLCLRGDDVLLRRLLDMGKGSDGALAEVLGSFYAELVHGRPRSFLQGLARRPEGEKKNLCFQAGATDGGGMSDEMLFGVSKKLHAIARTSGEPFAGAARLCLAQIESANVAARNPKP